MQTNTHTRIDLRAVGWIMVGALLVMAPSLRAEAQSVPGPCVLALSQAQLIPVSGALSALKIDDACRNVYVANFGNNTVDVISIASGTVAARIPVGASPVDLDFSPDGATLYVTNRASNSISMIDVASNTETDRIPVPIPSFLNDGPFSIAVARSGLVLFSTTFNGSGFGGRLLELNPATRVIRERRDFFFGSTTEATVLRASGDRSVIGIVVGDISSGPVFQYFSDSDMFTSERDLSTFINDLALNADGSVTLVDGGIVLDADLNQVGTIPGFGSGGVALDSMGMTGFRLRVGGVDVLDIPRHMQRDTLPLMDTVSFGFGIFGRLAISRDDALLAAVTDSGVSLVPTGIVRIVSFRRIDATAALVLRTGAQDDRFDLNGSFRIAAASDGIDPLSEVVTVQVGSESLSIPVGSFEKLGQRFEFSGTLAGRNVTCTIRPEGRDGFAIRARATGAQLAGTTLPINVSIAIGNDAGMTQLSTGHANF